MTTTPAAVSRPAHLKVRAGVAKVRSAKSSVRKVSKNGVYALVEVRHSDGSKTRYRVPTRSLSQRLAQESAAARAKTSA
jgi:hypothetical protein